MKKLYIYTLLLMSTLTLSCKKFLEEYSQDEMRPGSVSDLNSLMYGDAYPYNVSIETFDVLGDDVQNNPLTNVNGSPVATYLSALQANTLMYTFNPTMFDGLATTPESANVYTKIYLKIKGCNVLIDYVDKVSGSAADKNAILGQCLFLRGYYYLKLVTLYAQSYTAPGVNPESSLGVPLVLSSEVKDGGLKRNTLKEVYDQIEKDLIAAEELLRNNFVQPNVFRVNSDVANGILSRFYLYRGLDSDWEKAIQRAGQALQNRSTLTALSTWVGTNNSIAANGIYNATSPEVLWVYGGTHSPILVPEIDSRSLPPFSVSADLIGQYDKGTNTSNYGDLRFQFYFQSFTVNGSRLTYRTAKNTLNAQYGTKGLRVAELYLNRAEAYARKFLLTGNAGDRQAALADLNTLRQSRYDTRNTPYTPVNITVASDLYSFCQQERRRELALEDGHRFVDLKRWGLGVTHVFTGADNVTATYTLAPNSALFALPIPASAMNNNTELVQNPR